MRSHWHLPEKSGHCCFLQVVWLVSWNGTPRYQWGCWDSRMVEVDSIWVSEAKLCSYCSKARVLWGLGLQYLQRCLKDDNVPTCEMGECPSEVVLNFGTLTLSVLLQWYIVIVKNYHFGDHSSRFLSVILLIIFHV